MKLFKIIGNIAAILALIFIVLRLRRYDIPWERLLVPRMLLTYLLCAVAYAGCVLGSALLWVRFADTFAQDGNALRGHYGVAVRTYAKSNLYKYIPGNIFHFIGRNELAVQFKMSHAAVAAATLVEILFQTASAMLLSMLLIGPYTLGYIKAHMIQYALLISVGALMVAVAFLLIVFRKKKCVIEKLSELYSMLRDRMGLRHGVLCFAGVIALQIAGGLNFTAVLRLCNPSGVQTGRVKILIGTYVLSWLAGFITPGAPGGIGIRELILTTSIAGSGIARESVVLSASVLYRFVSILGDLMAFLFVFVFCLRKRN